MFTNDTKKVGEISLSSLFQDIWLADRSTYALLENW